tara:strand:+ start:66 stop:365 length:300 start_codon:yes stop_codon:yes gene_type:complete
MKYKIEGYANRLIVDENGLLVATYRQLPKHIASEIHLSSGFTYSNREDFLQHLHSLVDKKLLVHDLVTNVFLVHPKISGGGADMNKHRYPDKLIKFLNK